MRKHTFYYETNCINSTARKIMDMVDRARQITWKTFSQHVHWKEVRRVFPSYSYQGEEYNPDTEELTMPMHIKDDWAVGFYKSVYAGRPCYYISHSAIEYIFTEE